MHNEVILVGRLGDEPDAQTLTNGNSIAKFSLATTEKWTRDGEAQEKTEWHNIVVFGKLSDICSRYLTKGSLILVKGKIEYKTWDKQDGTKGYRTEILMREMKMLGDKSSDSKQEEDYSTIPF